MDVRIGWLALCVAALATGCSGQRMVRGPLPDWPWAPQQTPAAPCSSWRCTEADALAAYNSANVYCQQHLEDSQKGAWHGRGAKLAIKALGVIAGSILVPVTTGSTSTAWGGVAGAANAFGTQLDSTVVAAVGVHQRAAIATSARLDAERFQAAHTPAAQIAASMDMARECAMSAAIAEQKLLNALSNAAAP